MQVIFNSTQEITEFLEWAHKLGGLLAPQAGALPVDEAPGVPLTYAMPPADEPTSAGTDATPEQADKAPRKRRTKAEIEAAKAADPLAAPEASTAVAQPASEPENAPAQRSEPVAGANPFAAAPTTAQLVQAALNAAPEQHTTLANVAAAADKMAAIVDPVVAIPARAAEIGEIDPMEHMRRARDFIKQHGTQVYQKTFALAGVDSNVMKLTKSELALHLAAMEWIAAHPDA